MFNLIAILREYHFFTVELRETRDGFASDPGMQRKFANADRQSAVLTEAGFIQSFE